MPSWQLRLGTGRAQLRRHFTEGGPEGWACVSVASPVSISVSH